MGALQFDVVQFRLKDEYGVESNLERGSWSVLRWIHEGEVDSSRLVTAAQLALDSLGRRVILFADEWTCRYFTEKTPGVRLASLPPSAVPAETAAR